MQTQNKQKIINKLDHINICICTFKRSKYLQRLLNELQNQKTNDQITYSIIVVDNDYYHSGQNVVTSFKKTSTVKIDYYREPKRNISLARNMAVRNAKGKFVAFIDDDEFPEEGWLLNLYKAITQFKADGILGPVKPHFENEPPSWIIKSKILERQSFTTGTVIRHSKYTRTGNVLLYRNLYKNDEDYFDPIYGCIGGGDAVFFKRMMDKGRIFVWCNEALVFETVPIERLKRSYYIKRAFTRGIANAIHESIFSINTIKSLIAIFCYTLSLPFLVIIGNHLFMKYLIKDCDHVSKLLAFSGVKVVKERPY